VIWILCIALVLSVLIRPLILDVKREMSVRSTKANLRAIGRAVLEYLSEYGDSTDAMPAGLPPRELVYSQDFGLSQKLFMSPCGLPPASESNSNNLTVQYALDSHPDTLAYFRLKGQHAILFTDGSCNSDPFLWGSRIARTRGLGVRVSGQLVDHYKRGEPWKLDWW
jgi:hypothetical protein